MVAYCIIDSIRKGSLLSSSGFYGQHTNHAYKPAWELFNLYNGRNFMGDAGGN